MNILPDRTVETKREEDFFIQLELTEETTKQIRLSQGSGRVEITDSDSESV